MMKTNTWVYIKAVYNAIVIWILVDGFMLWRVHGNSDYHYSEDFYILCALALGMSFYFFATARLGKLFSINKFWHWMRSLNWISFVIMFFPGLIFILVVFLLNALYVKDPYHETMIYLGAYVIVAVAYTRYGLYKKEQEEDQSISQSSETV